MLRVTTRFCCRMTSHDQLQAVQQEIKKVGAQIDKADGELAKARADTDSKEVDFLRNSLVELRKEKAELCKEKAELREQQTILLRAQAPGQHCLPCQNWLKLHTPVCAHHVRANFPHCAVPLP